MQGIAFEKIQNFTAAEDKFLAALQAGYEEIEEKSH
jgi:hypothetical protein